MKKSELKEMIKAAFLSEADFTNAQDDDASAAVAADYDPLAEAEEDLDEILARLSEEEVVAEFRTDGDYFAKQLADLEADYKAGKIGTNQYEHEKDILNRYLQETISEEDTPENPEDYKNQPGYISEEAEDEATDIEDEEEVDVDVDVDTEEETDGGEEESTSNDSIVIDKKIVSLSSLPGETRKILDTLETLRAQAEEFGDQKFITQVGNTITFFTRDFVVAGDQPTMAKVDEGNKQYYKDAEADDAEHIKALEKDMKDDKKSSKKVDESAFPMWNKIK